PGERMPLSGLRPGCAVRMGAATFFIRKKLAEAQWQLENAETGEWRMFAEQDLLDQFTRNELTFERNSDGRQASAIDKAAANLARDLSSYPPDLVGLAQTRPISEGDRPPTTHGNHTKEHGTADPVGRGGGEGR